MAKITRLVVDYVVDPRVPLILGRPFLRTGRALIDVYGEELTLRHDDEAVTFKVGQTSRYFYNDAESINRIDVIDVAYGDDFLLEETDAFLAIEDDSISPKIDDSYYDSEGDIRLLEEFLNNDPSSPLPLKELSSCSTRKTKRRPPSRALMGRFPTDACLSAYVMLWARSKCAWSHFPTHERETMEVFMDDFSVFGDSFSLHASPI
ncbi:hypothetical protein Tco_0462780 [Tanacetum coccineum]